jgi:hypothetical protein
MQISERDNEQSADLKTSFQTFENQIKQQVCHSQRHDRFHVRCKHRRFSKNVHNHNFELYNFESLQNNHAFELFRKNL